ncbi:hypothetical protein Pint_01800 [Pistacia integerrima]|uniref:Uncharacterized protein n=1 Tax=Pistacia integerrima TaxID=434235 RepID=A0ACC0ZE87_9ROSI|nr:hypothetical protein Pint_01800 [Pistacia integerrima]
MILLVGEGDFSFSACLAKAFGSATNMVATSLSSEETLETKHWTNTAHLEYLKKKGCSIFHEVDVYDMNEAQKARRGILQKCKGDGLVLKEKVEFSKKDYHNKTGGGIESNKQFPLEQTFTFKFSLVPKNSW